jgi:hypothetical protein
MQTWVSWLEPSWAFLGFFEPLNMGSIEINCPASNQTICRGPLSNHARAHVIEDNCVENSVPLLNGHILTARSISLQKRNKESCALLTIFAITISTAPRCRLGRPHGGGRWTRKQLELYKSCGYGVCLCVAPTWVWRTRAYQRLWRPVAPESIHILYGLWPLAR